MARQNHGPLSRAKGKLGGVVYQQYEGMQISREYQPVVKNPQTTAQVKNRAKFKNASQAVAQFSEAINIRLAKLSIYTRIRRGAAINAIYNIVEAESTSTSAGFDDIINSLNGKSMAMIEAPELTAGSGNVLSIVAPSGDVVTYVAVNYDSEGKLMSREVETFTSDGSAKEATPATGAGYFGIMVVATRAMTEQGRATLGNITSGNNQLFLDISRAVGAGDVETSDIVGALRSIN